MNDLFRKLARFQVRRAGLVLAAIFATVLATGWLGSHLTVMAGFEHLLPDGAPSVVELHRVTEKTAGVSTLFVVIRAPEGQEVDRAAQRKASDATVLAVRAVGEPYVGSADNGVHDAVRFFEQHAGLYAELAALEKLSSDIEPRWEYEVAKAQHLLLDEDAPPPPLDVDGPSLRKRFGIDEEAENRFPDGYFESPDGRVHVVAVRSKILGGDLAGGTEAIRRIREAVLGVGLEEFQAGTHADYAGDLLSGVVEVRAINDDVTEVGKLGALFIAGIVLIYYLRIRTLVLMVVNVSIGLIWTAGAAWLLVTSLNTGSGFVFTILAGNGINTSIILMARYLEARRKGESLEDALGTAQAETWGATLAATVASSVSFLSLCLTEFRGYRELGLIGGTGLMLCWISTTIAMPALLTISERYAPISKEGTGPIARLRTAWEASFGRPFAAVAARAPRFIAVTGTLIALVGFGALVVYVRADPYEYDMNNLRNDPKSRAAEILLKKESDAITGYVGADGMAILVERVEQVGPLRTALYAKRDAVPVAERPFDKLVALEDFIPSEQEAKIPILQLLKKRLTKARSLGAIDDASWAGIQKYLPPDDLSPVGLAALPISVARPFTEKDGTRGRILFIVPASKNVTEDTRYLEKWADSYRKTTLPDGSTVQGSGRAVIYADMWGAVMKAVPQAVILSFLGVVMVVLVTFRARKHALLVIGALLAGIGWMAIGLLAVGAKLNFLNFVALPITLGIGVDYAVNVVWRAAREGPEGALTAVRETGGAVVLCSLTTTLGYLALVGSMNFAVRSLGVAAVIGEVCTLLAAMLVLPAVLVWIGRKHAKAPLAIPAEAVQESAR